MTGATGVLLVGGASTRFGSPKALARFGDETLAERGWRILGEAFAVRLAVGKGELELPFPVVVEPAEPQAPLAGVVAGLRAATTEVSRLPPGRLPARHACAAAGAGRTAGRHGDRAACRAPTRSSICRSSSVGSPRATTRSAASIHACSTPTRGCSRTRIRPPSCQRSNRTSPLSISITPEPVSTASRPSRVIICAVPAAPSTVTRRPRRKSRAPRSS